MCRCWTHKLEELGLQPRWLCKEQMNYPSIEPGCIGNFVWAGAKDRTRQNAPTNGKLPPQFRMVVLAGDPESQLPGLLTLAKNLVQKGREEDDTLTFNDDEMDTDENGESGQSVEQLKTLHEVFVQSHGHVHAPPMHQNL